MFDRQSFDFIGRIVFIINNFVSILWELFLKDDFRYRLFVKFDNLFSKLLALRFKIFIESLKEIFLYD